MSDEATFAAHNLIAAVPDMDVARDVIEQLEKAGVDGNHISLLGRRALEAQADDGLVQDERVFDKSGRVAAGGIGAGTVVGGAAGFLAGLAAFGVPGVGPAIAGGIWALTLGGAAAGAGVGLATAGYLKIQQSEAWEMTYASVNEGKVVVGVHTDDESEVERARDVFSAAGGEINSFDRQGNPLAPPERA